MTLEEVRADLLQRWEAYGLGDYHKFVGEQHISFTSGEWDNWIKVKDYCEMNRLCDQLDAAMAAETLQDYLLWKLANF